VTVQTSSDRSPLSSLNIWAPQNRHRYSWRSAPSIERLEINCCRSCACPRMGCPAMD
jgi:hypothetical protein